MPRKAHRAPFYSKERQTWCIPLSNSVVAFVDEDIAHSIGWQAWSAAACGDQWRAIQRPWDKISKSYSSVYMHRVITGATDPSLDVDHRFHAPLADKIIDNRRANLRICNHANNQRNIRLPKNNTSGYKGVTWRADTGRWQAGLMFNYRHISLGSFDDKLLAAKSYDDGATKYFGEFALTNAALGLL